MSILKLVVVVAVLLIGGCSSDRDIKLSQQTRQIVNANLRLGVAYLERGRYEQSLQKLERARDADPHYAPTYGVLGLLYQELREFSLAESNFKKSLELDPEDSSTLNNYGQFLCQQGRVETANKAFLKAAENPLYEIPELAYTNAGLCAQANGQNDLAMHYYRKALESDPEMQRALLNMGDLHYKRKEFLSARAYIQRYAHVAQHNPKSLWLGILIEKQLDGQDVLASYGLLLLHKFPDSEEAKKYQDMLEN